MTHKVSSRFYLKFRVIHNNFFMLYASLFSFFLLFFFFVYIIFDDILEITKICLLPSTAATITDRHRDRELQTSKESTAIHISSMQPHRKWATTFGYKQKAVSLSRESFERFPKTFRWVWLLHFAEWIINLCAVMRLLFVDCPRGAPSLQERHRWQKDKRRNSSG